MSLPIRRNKFDVQGFLAWLSDNGAEIGTPSNPYEVVRYRAYWKQSKRPETQIVYAKESGLLTWMKGTQGHYLTFMEGKPMVGNKPRYSATFEQPETTTKKQKPSKSKGAETRAKLLKRDGDECWFCGERMGDDCTIEHLIPKADGGRNALANYALAHQSCNNAAANKPLVEKLALRAEMRGQTV